MASCILLKYPFVCVYGNRSEKEDCFLSAISTTYGRSKKRGEVFVCECIEIDHRGFFIDNIGEKLGKRGCPCACVHYNRSEKMETVFL